MNLGSGTFEMSLAVNPVRLALALMVSCSFDVDACSHLEQIMSRRQR